MPRSPQPGPTDIAASSGDADRAGRQLVFDLRDITIATDGESRFDGEACRIVTRFKKTTPLQVIEARPVPEGTNILSDRIGFSTTAGQKPAKPRHAALREIQVRLDTGKVLRILSNDLDAAAEEIADLYKRRWAIELFFRLESGRSIKMATSSAPAKLAVDHPDRRHS